MSPVKVHLRGRSLSGDLDLWESIISRHYLSSTWYSELLTEIVKIR
ncbi:MAG: hypothetical protein WA700_07535 [Acidobacteriaceae bacterium]